MDSRHLAALLAGIDRLDPGRAPTTAPAAAERIDQWTTLLADVPATAPHPEGRHWDASQVARQHIATSPYPIKPADIGARWQTFRRDILGRHVDPAPPVDPDNQAAYRAALRAGRAAIETGAAVATPRAALPTGSRKQREAADAATLAQLGTYVPRTVAQQLAPQRPIRARREADILAGRPDALAVDCPVTSCRAAAGQPCTRPGRRPGQRHRLSGPHPSRTDLAAHHQTHTGAQA
ncbi:cell surface glycoprotein [Streptomyces sp. NPDC056500]|uniref:zinc finger domain-containing protein n=1 Tax=Streptomyces sp. NPDC056500 TaxID=3345840 RepID=UPI0036990E5A